LIAILLLLQSSFLVGAQFQLPGQDPGEREKTDMDDIPLDEPEGLLSFVDILPNTNPLECFGEAGLSQATSECVPNTEVVDVSRFEDCQEDLATCEDRYAYTVPFIPEDSADQIEEDIDEAWETFVDDTIATGNDRVNDNPKCYVPLSFCPAIIRWDCVMERVADTLRISVTEHQPEYWKAVGETLLTHSPLALYWRAPLPTQGAVISPVTALTPNPEVYRQLLDEPADAPYFMGPPLMPNLPVPALPGDIQEPWPGLYDKELRKYGLDLASVAEYQQFGYSSFFITHGELEAKLFFKALSGPYIWTWCLTPTLPPIPVPIPIPIFLVFNPATPRAFTTWDSIPEGYPIPWIKHDPIWLGE
jgi:hypothetical protein